MAKQVFSVLYIIRGLPGSGKSTLGEQLCPGRSFQDDDYWTGPDGVYRYDPETTEQANRHCYNQVRTAMTDPSQQPVAVCCPFVRKSDYASYLQLCKELGWQAFVVVCLNEYGDVHDVQPSSRARMIERWEH